MIVIFLDIDGVLNRLDSHPNGYHGFHPQCVEAFNFILNEISDAKIVVSSSWRYMVHSGNMSLKGLEFVLQVGGVEAHNRVEGVTCTDEEIHARADQIHQWLIDHPDVSSFVVLDDLPTIVKLAGRGLDDHIVKTEGTQGLTFELAAEAIDKLNR